MTLIPDQTGAGAPAVPPGDQAAPEVDAGDTEPFGHPVEVNPPAVAEVVADDPPERPNFEPGPWSYDNR